VCNTLRADSSWYLRYHEPEWVSFADLESF
jgi:hypothetical protein